MLNVYSDDYEMVIAESKADAEAVSAALSGSPSDLTPEERWEEQSLDTTTPIWCDAKGDPCEIESGTLVRRTNREWIELRGRGWLCGSET